MLREEITLFLLRFVLPCLTDLTKAFEQTKNILICILLKQIIKYYYLCTLFMPTFHSLN